MGKHEQCEFHKQAVVVLSKTKYVSEMLSTKVVADKEKNQTYFLKVLSTIRFLAHQGLPLRGDNEIESNFIQLMLLLGEDFEGIGEFLEKRQLKYTSNEIQNEILSLMSQSILHDIVKKNHSAVYFSIMVDETTDMANKEQVVMVLVGSLMNWVFMKIFWVYMKHTQKHWLVLLRILCSA